MTELNASGERLASSLISFLDRSGNELAKGNIVLRLQPRAVEYLISRLQFLLELEALKQSSPAEFFRGAFTDLEEYSKLQKLQQGLHWACSVCIQPSANHFRPCAEIGFRTRDPTRVNLTPFQNLLQLELVGCDLSTTAWVGLNNVQKVCSLKCTGCLEELQHLLLPFSHLLASQGDRTRVVWPNLTSLQCTHNAFDRIDSSLKLPALRALDLSNNNICVIENLHMCSNLTSLNLSYNNIEALMPLRECTTTLQRLILQGNAARSLKGLQHLVALTELDLRCNLLASYQEFHYLKELTGLRCLYLDGNPLAYAPFYRLDVLAWFDDMPICLDGVRPKKSESLAVAMRATGEVPFAWQIMAQYISQQQLLWRPKEAVPPRGSLLWRTNSLAGQPLKPSPIQPNPSRHARMHPKKIPARRIVDFTGDPRAVLESTLERPPSPSPFQPPRDDSTDSVSRASTASTARLPMLRTKDKMTSSAVQTIYRERTAHGHGLQSTASDISLPKYDQDRLKDLEALEHPVETSDRGSDSESSSLDTASSQEGSPGASPRKSSPRP